MSLVVVKVGGSLFDLPDLQWRLQTWLPTLYDHFVLLVPGGGAMVDAIREMDQQHGFGEERAHWAALNAMTVTADLLAQLLGSSRNLVAKVTPEIFRGPPGAVRILDAHAFALLDEGKPGCLPHSWDVTSDSVAARVAALSEAAGLILLKSTTIPEGISWAEAGRRGFVDNHFAEVLKQAPSLEVRAINFRAWPSDTTAE